MHFCAKKHKISFTTQEIIFSPLEVLSPPVRLHE